MDLLLLPGLDGTGRLFAPFLAALSRDVSATVLEYPSDRPLGYGELLPIVNGHAPERAYAVLGESFSGPLALLHAATRPEHLRAVILAASFARNPAPRGTGPLLSMAGELPFRFAAWRAGIRFLLSGFDAPRQLVEDVAGVVRGVPPRVLAHRSSEVLAIDVRDRLARIEVPILSLVGTRDRLVGRRSLEELLALRPEMQVVELEAPHLLLQRRPAAAAESIAQFMTATATTD